MGSLTLGGEGGLHTWLPLFIENTNTTHTFLRIHKHRTHTKRNSLTLMRSVTKKKPCTENQSWTGWRKSRRIAHFAIGIQFDFVMRADVMRDVSSSTRHHRLSCELYIFYGCMFKFTRVEFLLCMICVPFIGIFEWNVGWSFVENSGCGNGDGDDTDDDDDAANCKRMIDTFTSQ